MKVKSGDIFSIETAKGRAYFQYFGKNSLMGSLIRVLPGVYGGDAPELHDIVSRETNFWTFFPVAGAWKSGVIKKEANLPLPSHAAQFPLFRAGIPGRDSARVKTWWLWDGEKEWMLGDLSEEQRKLPIRASWNDTLLVERIEAGWLPESDPC